DALTLAGSAAHGGSRHEEKSVSTEYDRLCTVKKSPSPAAGTSGHEYELYYVNHLHITFTFARLVYDLPGEICCFLRPVSTANNSLKKISKRRRLAGRRTISIRSMCGKGRTPPNPPQKGGEKMETPNRKFGEWGQFDRYCKLVLYHEAIDYLREMQRRRDMEISLDELSPAQWDKLPVTSD